MSLAIEGMNLIRRLALIDSRIIQSLVCRIIGRSNLFECRRVYQL